MKLTKGKLSKIQNKKKQTLKRYKKGGKTRKSKTFRKRKHVNLHNASLKKYKGGSGELTEAKPATSEVEPIQTDPITQTSLTPSSEQTAQPILEEAKPTLDEEQQNLEEVNPTLEEEQQNLEEEAKPTLEAAQPTLGEEEQQDLETPLEDATTTQTPISSDPGEGPGSNEALPPPVSEEGTEQLTEPEIETNNLDNADAVSQEPPKFDSEPVSVDATQVENTPPIVVESLENLLDYISTKIAKKLQQTSSFGSNKNTELNKDSFNSVANANETLAEA